MEHHLITYAKFCIFSLGTKEEPNTKGVCAQDTLAGTRLPTSAQPLLFIAVRPVACCNTLDAVRLLICWALHKNLSKECISNIQSTGFTSQQQITVVTIAHVSQQGSRRKLVLTWNKHHAFNVAWPQHLFVPAMPCSLCFLRASKLHIGNSSACALTRMVTSGFQVDVIEPKLESCRLQMVIQVSSKQWLTRLK